MITTQLIKLSDNTATMTSFEIAELVESRHDNVKTSIERLAKRGAIQLPAMQETDKINNLDLIQKHQHYLFSGGQGKRDSIIVVAQLSPEFTARLVDRWQELEEMVAYQIPQTFPEALRLAAEFAEINVKLTAEAEKAKPKIAFHDAVKASPTAIDMSQFAKLLGTGRKRMFAWLRDNKYLMTNNLPYQQYVDSEFFRVVECLVSINGEGVLKTKTLVTGKGQIAIQKKWQKGETTLFSMTS